MTHTHEQIEIPLSKQKLILLFIGSIGFVAAGIWVVISPPVISNPFFGNPTFMLVAGIASILFFGLSAVYIARKLPDNEPGLILDKKGLTDNTGSVSAGQIWWRDIEQISVVEIHRQKLIMLKVTNPQDYIDKQPGAFKRKIMQMNFNMYGTPLSISANALQIKFDDLIKLLQDHLSASRQ